MKRENYVILMVAALAAMVLASAVPCRAYWFYIGSEVSEDDPNGYYYESGNNYQFEQEYRVSGVSTSASSGGAEASASCEASASVEVMPSGASVSKSAGAWCATYGDSYYGNTNGQGTLYYEWEVSGSGTVTVEGGVDDSSLGTGDTADSSASASADVSSAGGGYGYAGGSVSEYSTGTAGYGFGGYGSEDYGDTDEDAGYYYATLSFTVSGGSDQPIPYEGYQFTASASVSASASCDASVSASQGYSGSAGAAASADSSGSAWVSVSY